MDGPYGCNIDSHKFVWCVGQKNRKGWCNEGWTAADVDDKRLPWKRHSCVGSRTGCIQTPTALHLANLAASPNDLIDQVKKEPLVRMGPQGNLVLAAYARSDAERQD